MHTTKLSPVEKIAPNLLCGIKASFERDVKKNYILVSL